MYSICSIAKRLMQSSAPHLYDDNRWYWFYNSGLEAQSGIHLVWFKLFLAHFHHFHTTVLWRSKTSKIPDPTKDSDDTEIFFDVRNFTHDPGSVFADVHSNLTSAHRPMLWPKTVQPLSLLTTSPTVASTSHTQYQYQLVTVIPSILPRFNRS